MPAATFRTLNRQFQLTGITCHSIGCHCFNQQLVPKTSHCFDRKKRSCPQFLLLHYCLLVIPHSDMNFWDFLGFFEILKVADLNLTDLHPKLRTVNGLKTMKHGDIGISINGNGDQRGYESKCDGATLSNSSIGMEVRQTCLIPPYSTVHVGSSDVKKKTDTSDTYFFAFQIIPYKCCKKI